MTVPFAKLDVAVKAENTEREELRIAETLIKKTFPGFPVSKTMSEIKVQMANGMELEKALASVVPELPFELHITNLSCNVHCLISGDFKSSPTICKAVEWIGEAREREEACAVIFKIKNMGLFVMHSISMTGSSKPRIVIPAVKAGIDQLEIIHLSFFTQYFRTLWGSSGWTSKQ